MRVLNRYLWSEVLKLQLLALLGLCMIFGLFALYEQTSHIGKGTYSVLDAIWYVFLTTPDRMVDMAPMAALLGTLFVLERLSRGNELTTMLVAGYSPLRLTRRIMLACTPLIIITIVCAQWIAPPLYQQAELHRIIRTTDANQPDEASGVWFRRGLQIMNIAIPAADIENNLLLVYELNEDGSLKHQIMADSFIATADGEWHLFDVTEHIWKDGKLSIRQMEEHLWKPFMSNIQAELQQLPLNTLSLSRLHDKYLHALKVGANSYQINLFLWQRLLSPLTIFAMAILVAVFTLTGIARTGLGQGIIACLFTGILTYALGRFLGSQNIVDLHPIITGLFPSCALVMIALVTAYRHKMI